MELWLPHRDGDVGGGGGDVVAAAGGAAGGAGGEPWQQEQEQRNHPCLKQDAARKRCLKELLNGEDKQKKENQIFPANGQLPA